MLVGASDSEKEFWDTDTVVVHDCVSTTVEVIVDDAESVVVSVVVGNAVSVKICESEIVLIKETEPVETVDVRDNETVSIAVTVTELCRERVEVKRTVLVPVGVIE